MANKKAIEIQREEAGDLATVLRERDRMEATATQLRAEIAVIQEDLRVGRKENERLWKENLRLTEDNRKLRDRAKADPP